MDVGVVLQLVDEREQACRAELDRLPAEVERVTGLLAACRGELERLVTTRRVVGELTGVGPVAASAPVSRAGPVAAGGDLEVFTEQVIAVLVERDRPVRCQEIVAALGQDASLPRHVERVRHRLKKLRTAGRVEEIAPGMFTPAGRTRYPAGVSAGYAEGSSTSWSGVKA